MPELPEVETIRRDLEKVFINKRIVHIQLNDPFILTGFNHSGQPKKQVHFLSFQSHVLNKNINKIIRRGKYLIFEFKDNSALIFHLRMTGQLLLQSNLNKFRIQFTFDSGLSLSFVDRRRFGSVFYSEEWEKDPSIQNLGVEPFLFDQFVSSLIQHSQKRKCSIHSLLLNQTVVAGIGNIYAAEALFLAKILPQKAAQSITVPSLKKLAQAVVQVLNDSIQSRGYSMSTYVDALGKKGRSQLFSKVYGKENQACCICKTILQKIRLSGRGVVFCRKCQR